MDSQIMVLEIIILCHMLAICYGSSWNYKGQVYESRLQSHISFTNVFVLAAFLSILSYIADRCKKHIHANKKYQKHPHFHQLSITTSSIIIIDTIITQTRNRTLEILVITHYLSYLFQ